MTDLLTGALVLITGFYAWATFRILRANERVIDVMRSQAEALTRPYVVVAPFLELDNPILYLRVTNVGKTAAEKLRLSFDKPFHRHGENDDLGTYPAFTETIDAFPPGAALEFSLVAGFRLFAENVDRSKLPTVFTVRAEYRYADKTVKEANVIDLRPYSRAQIPQNAYIRKLNEISESLEAIAKYLTTLARQREGGSK